MKKIYFFVLKIITTTFVIGLALLKMNEASGNVMFAIPPDLQKYVDFAVDYGAMTLLCLFAFGGLAGRIVKFIIGGLVVLAIIIFIIATAAPAWIAGLFGGGAEAVIGLL